MVAKPVRDEPIRGHFPDSLWLVGLGGLTGLFWREAWQLLLSWLG